jgi:hypothetical protein
MYNRQNLTDQLRLVTHDQVQTMFGLFDRDVFATEWRSMEVFRDGHYFCSLRVNETGMGGDVKPAMQEAKLRNGDLLYYVDLAPRVLHLSGSLTTRDRYTPGYHAEITVRVNNPLVFLQAYFQGMRDAKLDPMMRFKAAVERAFKRYAEATDHDKLKGRELESAAFKNREGRNLGIWIDRSVADIVEDPHRQKIREIEKQTEVEKARERSRAEVQSVKADYSLLEEAKQREHSRREKSKDTLFTLDEEEKKQMYAYQQKIREIVFSTVHPQWADYVLQELEKVDNSLPDFFSKNPQLLQYYPGLSQLISLPQPRLALDSPSTDPARQNIAGIRHNRSQKQRG